MQNVRACIHCQLLREINGKLICAADEARSTKLDLVLGEYTQRGAYDMRAPKGPCGPEGKLYLELSAPVKAEVAAIVRANGPSTAVRVREMASAVYSFPGNVMVGTVQIIGDKWRGGKARLARFGQRVAAARAAWHGIMDNTVEPPVLLTADPIAEAQAVADGKGPIVNAEAMAQLELAPEVLKPGAPTQTEPTISDASVDDKSAAQGEAAADAAKQAVPLANVADHRQEAAVAQAIALAITALLLGYIVAGMAVYGANHPGTLSSLLRTSEAHAGNCTECRKGEYCYPCIPPRKGHEAGCTPRKAPRYQMATIH